MKLLKLKHLFYKQIVKLKSTWSYFKIRGECLKYQKNNLSITNWHIKFFKLNNINIFSWFSIIFNDISTILRFSKFNDFLNNTKTLRRLILISQKLTLNYSKSLKTFVILKSPHINKTARDKYYFESKKLIISGDSLIKNGYFVDMLFKIFTLLRRINIIIKNKLNFSINFLIINKNKAIFINGLFRAKLNEFLTTRSSSKTIIHRYFIENLLTFDTIYSFFTNWKYNDYLKLGWEYGRPKINLNPKTRSEKFKNFLIKSWYFWKTWPYVLFIIPSQILWFLGEGLKRTRQFHLFLLNAYQKLDGYYLKCCISQLDFISNPIISSLWLKNFGTLYKVQNIKHLDGVRNWVFNLLIDFFNKDYRFSINSIRAYLLHETDFISEDFKTVRDIEEQINYTKGWDLQKIEDIDPKTKEVIPSEFSTYNELKNKIYFDYADSSKRSPFSFEFFEYVGYEISGADMLWDQPKVIFYNVETWSRFWNSICRFHIKYPQVYKYLKDKNPDAFLRWSDYIASNLYNHALVTRWDSFCDNYLYKKHKKNSFFKYWDLYIKKYSDSIKNFSAWDIHFDEKPYVMKFLNQLEGYGEFDLVTNDKNFGPSKLDYIKKYKKRIEIETLKEVATKFSFVPFIQENNKKQKLYKRWLFTEIFPPKTFILNLPNLAETLDFWKETKFFTCKILSWNKSFGYNIFGRTAFGNAIDPFESLKIDKIDLTLSEEDQKTRKKELDGNKSNFLDSKYTIFLNEKDELSTAINKVFPNVLVPNYYFKIQKPTVNTYFYTDYFNPKISNAFSKVYNCWVQDHLTLWNMDLLHILFLNVDKRNSYLGPVWTHEYFLKYFQSSYDENWFGAYDMDSGIEINTKIMNFSFFDIRYHFNQQFYHPLAVWLFKFLSRKIIGNLTSFEWLLIILTAWFSVNFGPRIYDDVLMTFDIGFSHNQYYFETFLRVMHTVVDIFKMDNFNHIFDIDHKEWINVVHFHWTYNLFNWLMEYLNSGYMSIDFKSTSDSTVFEDHYKDVANNILVRTMNEVNAYERNLLFLDLIQRQTYANSAIYDSLNELYGPYNAEKFYYNFTNDSDFTDSNNKFIADFVKIKYFNWYLEHELGQPTKLWEYRLNKFSDIFFSNELNRYFENKPSLPKYKSMGILIMDEHSTKLKYAFSSKKQFFGPLVTSATTELEHLRWFYDSVNISVDSIKFGKKWGPTEYINPKWVMPDFRMLPEKYKFELTEKTKVNNTYFNLYQAKGIDTAWFLEDMVSIPTSLQNISNQISNHRLKIQKSLRNILQNFDKQKWSSMREKLEEYQKALKHRLKEVRREISKYEGNFKKQEILEKEETEIRTRIFENDKILNTKEDFIARHYLYLLRIFKALHNDTFKTSIDIHKKDSIFKEKYSDKKYNAIGPYIILNNGYAVTESQFQELCGESINYYDTYDVIGYGYKIWENTHIGTYYKDSRGKFHYFVIPKDLYEALKINISGGYKYTFRDIHFKEFGYNVNNITYNKRNQNRIQWAGYFFDNTLQPNYFLNSPFKSWSGGYSPLKYTFDNFDVKYINSYKKKYSILDVKGSLNTLTITWGSAYYSQEFMNTVTKRITHWAFDIETEFHNGKQFSVSFPYRTPQYPNWVTSRDDNCIFDSEGYQFDIGTHENSVLYNIPLLRNIQDYYSYLWSVKNNLPKTIEQVGKLWHPVNGMNVIDNVRVSWLNGRTTFNYLESFPTENLIAKKYKRFNSDIVINDLAITSEDYKYLVPDYNLKGWIANPKYNKSYKDDFTMHQAWRFLHNWKSLIKLHSYAPNSLEFEKKDYGILKYLHTEKHFSYLEHNSILTDPTYDYMTNSLTNVQPILNDNVSIDEVGRIFATFENEFSWFKSLSKLNYAKTFDRRKLNLLYHFENLKNTNKYSNYDPFGISNIDSDYLYSNEDLLDYLNCNKDLSKWKYGFDYYSRNYYNILNQRKMLIDSHGGSESLRFRPIMYNEQNIYRSTLGPFLEIIFSGTFPFYAALDDLKLSYLNKLTIFKIYKEKIEYWMVDFNNFWKDYEIWKSKWHIRHLKKMIEVWYENRLNKLYSSWKEIYNYYTTDVHYKRFYLKVKMKLNNWYEMRKRTTKQLYINWIKFYDNLVYELTYERRKEVFDLWVEKKKKNIIKKWTNFKSKFRSDF